MCGVSLVIWVAWGQSSADAEKLPVKTWKGFLVDSVRFCPAAHLNIYFFTLGVSVLKKTWLPEDVKPCHPKWKTGMKGEKGVKV
jgi:hypothetical protein